MNAQQIDDILSQAKIDKRGRIMNKGRLNDMLHSLHLREVEKLNIPADMVSVWRIKNSREMTIIQNPVSSIQNPVTSNNKT